jgi:hypothetical protein
MAQPPAVAPPDDPYPRIIIWAEAAVARTSHGKIHLIRRGLI